MNMKKLWMVAFMLGTLVTNMIAQTTTKPNILFIAVDD